MDPRTLGLPLLLLAGAATAQTFVLESAVIDSRSGANLGVSTERGDVAALFRAQKSLTFGILRSAGVDINALAPEVRARIERFQTTNLEAFRAFSNGLDLKDQGRYAEARAQFQRAAELDPGFALAVEQQQAMPEVTLGTAVQLRAVLAASAGQAVSRGQASYVVDAQRAVAAAQGGLAVVQAPLPAPTDAEILDVDPTKEFTVNEAGSGTNFVPNLGTATTFGLGSGVRVAINGEWKAGQYRTEGGQLVSAGDPAAGLALQRGGATAVPGGSTDLADGSRVYWGRWMSTASASASVQFRGNVFVAPELGAVDWIAGEATRQLPASSTATFLPAGGGNLGNVSGSLLVNFQLRTVALQNLGFTLDGLAFSGLQGSAAMRAGSLSGLFDANYTAGSCSGCTNFLPTASSFGGNFLGRNADGLLFSTTLATDGGTRAGITLLKKEP